MAGEEKRILLGYPIATIVDVFDALTHERPYKQAWPIDRAVAEITAQSGRQFDHALVQAFLRSLPQLLEVQAPGSLLPVV